MHNIIEEYLDVEGGMNQYEGSTGVASLCKLVKVMGYTNYQQYGNIGRGANVSDLAEFLSDNPGAIEALMEWISNQNVAEWKESIKQHIQEMKSEQ